jgi:hypothetical protein
VKTDSPVERSLSAVKGFKERVVQMGLWTGAWVGVVAIRKDTDWLPFLFRVHLMAAGVRIPTKSKFFDATTRDILVRSVEIDLPQCWMVLEGLANNNATELSKLLGERVALHMGQEPTAWSFSRNAYPKNARAQYRLSGGGSAEFHKIYGSELFERLAPQLRVLKWTPFLGPPPSLPNGRRRRRRTA